MKVALLHFCFYEYTVQLANALANYVDLTLIHPQELSAQCQNILNSNIHVYSFDKPRIRNLSNISSMSKMMDIIHKLQPDVLHVQETNDPWYDLTLLLNQMPPLVTTIHDVFRHPGDKDAVPGSEYTRRLAFYKSQQLIVHAHLLKDALVQQFHIAQPRVCVLPHGELGSMYEKLATDTSVQREPHTLLFYGRIWPYKGLKYLLEAMPLIAERIPEVKLVIAGRGENLEECFPHGHDPKRYEILNHFIPSEDVATLFKRSTAVILPYIEASQSGVAAVALAMGTPVVASKIGGLAEMIRHEEDGLLVPPGNVAALADAIIRLLSDRQLQQKLQIAGWQRCQNDLNWSNIAKQTVEVYDKAIYLKNQTQQKNMNVETKISYTLPSALKNLKNIVSSLRFENFQADLDRYVAIEKKHWIFLLLTKQGLWALAEYRYSRWVFTKVHIPGIKHILKFFAILWHKLIEITTSIDLPSRAEIGKGVYIAHFGGIFINENVKIGDYCTLSQDVAIGVAGRGEKRGCPTLGDRVYLAPGCRVIGAIAIGNEVAIGANAVVTKDLPDKAVAVGVPAKIINYKGNADFTIYT
jgi:serine acetyltransferase/glycosyltransferase involved in cell wall biosynthesis